VSATAPNMGPRIAPKTAAPNAVPISSPRRLRGVATVSQARAPAQVVVLEKPWASRASPIPQGPSARAKAKLESASSTSPATTATLGPQRMAASPPGMPPKSAPIPKAATSSPAPVFESPNSPAYPGTSGVSAPKSIASTKTTVETRINSRRMAPRSYLRGVAPQQTRARAERASGSQTRAPQAPGFRDLRVGGIGEKPIP
jgi:hypothetical protein